MSPSPPLARFDIRCLWQASMRAFYMNLHRIPKSTLRYSVSDSCLASRWMDGWMTDSLPKRIYINTLGVCVCALQMDNKTFLSTLKSYGTVLIEAYTNCQIPKHSSLLFSNRISLAACAVVFHFYFIIIFILWSLLRVVCLFNLSHCRVIFGFLWNSF